MLPYWRYDAVRQGDGSLSDGRQRTVPLSASALPRSLSAIFCRQPAVIFICRFSIQRIEKHRNFQFSIFNFPLRAKVAGLPKQPRQLDKKAFQAFLSSLRARILPEGKIRNPKKPVNRLFRTLADSIRGGPCPLELPCSSVFLRRFPFPEKVRRGCRSSPAFVLGVMRFSIADHSAASSFSIAR